MALPQSVAVLLLHSVSILIRELIAGLQSALFQIIFYYICLANELIQPNLLRNATNPTRPFCRSFIIYLNFDSIQILIEKT